MLGAGLLPELPEFEPEDPFQPLDEGVLLGGGFWLEFQSEFQVRLLGELDWSGIRAGAAGLGV